MKRDDAPRPPSLWHRHDLLVVVVATALLVAGAFIYRKLVEPKMVEFSHAGLTFQRPTGFFPPVDVDAPATSFGGLGGLGGLAAQGSTAAQPATVRYHKLYKTPAGPLVALEVLIDRKPLYRGLGIVLQQARRQRYGEFLWVADAEDRNVGGAAWARTEFQYATKATQDDAPQVATGIEYATVNGDRLYVVTVHGTTPEAMRLESLIQTTLTLGAGGN